MRPNGSLASYSGRGMTADFRSNGQIRKLHTPTMDITRGPRGQRVIVSHLPDHRIIVCTGRRTGYVERPVFARGHALIERTYVANNHTFTRVYDIYHFHGLEFQHYVPTFHYDPHFYGWAFYPWPRPIAFAWPWWGAAWLSFYGPYFALSPQYPGAPYWLTDYMMASTLQNAYDAQLQAPGDGDAPSADVTQNDGSSDEAYAPAPTPITPDLKASIAEGVRQQLAYESAAVTQPDQEPTLTDLPQVLQPNRMFIVDNPVNAVTDDDVSCSLSGGDVLRLLSRPDEGAVAADLTVASGNQYDCPAGARLSLPLQDLEEMQNNFRAQIDAGLKILHDGQGRNGLPAAPPSAIGPPPRPSEYGAAAADANAGALLDQAQQQAAAAERQAEQDAFAPSVGSQTGPNN